MCIYLSCRWQRLWEPQHLLQLQWDLHQLFWHQALTCNQSLFWLHFPPAYKPFPGGIAKLEVDSDRKMESKCSFRSHSWPHPTKNQNYHCICECYRLSVNSTHLLWIFIVTCPSICTWEIAYFHPAVLNYPLLFFFKQSDRYWISAICSYLQLWFKTISMLLGF